FQYTQTPLARETNYITNLLNERDFAKEIRLFGLQEYLLDRWSKKFKKNASESLKLLRKEKYSQIALDGLTAILYACSVGVIVWLAKKKDTYNWGLCCNWPSGSRNTKFYKSNLSAPF
ncbi:hypothetical protein H1215_09740, partial [Anoxybacillus sp. LAT_38]|nr:hypothetical protein [Anoxybacillus sp. LAT_38]